MPNLLELRIEELLLEHRQVRKKKVGKYVIKIKYGEPIGLASVTYCVHEGKYYLDDGHHRVLALLFLGRSSVLSQVEPCYLYGCEGNRTNSQHFYNIRHIILA